MRKPAPRWRRRASCTSTHRLNWSAARSIGWRSTLERARIADRSRPRRPRGTFSGRLSSSAVTFTPGGKEPKNETSRVRKTLMISTSYCCARCPARLRTVRIVPPIPQALTRMIVTRRSAPTRSSGRGCARTWRMSAPRTARKTARLADMRRVASLRGNDMDEERRPLPAVATGRHATRSPGGRIRGSPAVPSCPPMRRDQLPPHRSATYVMPRWKAVYVSVNKAACTSLKWLVADLQGERPEQFHGSLSREVGRAMTIHKRALWEHTPMLHRLPKAELEEISPDNGWFVFAVVRHPAARVWSAWQSKLLLREPAWLERFGAEPWFPRVPTGTEQIGEDFARFVAFVEEQPEHPMARNRHVAPQHRLLVPDRMSYSRIYGTREIPVLL